LDLTQSHFELFGLDPGFDLDRDKLAAIYRDLQRSVHPDRFAGASEHERRLSVQRAAQINDAYRTLGDPLSRARYLLELKGKATGEQSNTAMDPAFLMEQMEWRERLEQVAHADQPLQQLGDIGSELGQRRKRMVQRLSGLFRTGSDTALEQAAQQVRELRFIERLLQEVADKEDRFM